jgi:hypothetical protein
VVALAVLAVAVAVVGVVVVVAVFAPTSRAAVFSAVFSGELRTATHHHP